LAREGLAVLLVIMQALQVEQQLLALLRFRQLGDRVEVVQ
jgi:hypothetical protein